MTREEAIRILERRSTIPDAEASWLDIMQAFNMAIEALKEQRPHGEWLPTDEIGNVVRCSQCSFRTCADVAEEEYNFCPNCGAPMTEEAFRKYNGLKEGDEK